MKKTIYFFMIIIVLSLSVPVLSTNDPGHDSLYIEQLGDSVLNGSLKIIDLLYNDNLNIIGNGSIPSPSNRIIGTSTDLYVESPYNIIFNGLEGTSNTIKFGNDVSDNVNLNITGDVYVKSGKDITIGGVSVCLSNGTNCVNGNNTGNVSSVSAGNGISVTGTNDVTVSVDTTSISGCTGTGDKVVWDSGNNRFTCGTDQNSDSLSGSGSSGKLVKWTGSNSLGDSIISESGSALSVGGDVLITSSLSVGDDEPFLQINYEGSGVQIGDINGIDSGTKIKIDSTTNKITMPNGNIGIGTSNPSEKLEVAGNITPSANDTYSLGTPDLVWKDVYVGNSSLYIGGKKLSMDGTNLLWGGSRIATENNGLGGTSLWTNSSGNATFTSGNVGIGTTTPGEKLEVNGNINASGDICISGGKCLSTTGTGSGDVVGPASATDNAVARFDSTTGKLIQNSGVIIDDNGNVGIGTTSPSRALHVNQTSAVVSAIIQGNNGAGQLVDIKAGNSGASYNGIRFLDDSGNSKTFIGYRNNQNTISFATNQGTTDLMVINISSSNVGIGTTTPGEKLEVNGNINASGDICISGGKCLSTTGTGSGDITAVNIGSNTCASGDCNISTLDGSGSGLDADLLDGRDSSYFLSGESDTLATVTSRGSTTSSAVTVGSINTGSGAMELGDAAITNGDTNSVPTNDQVYDFVTGQGYITGYTETDPQVNAVTNGKWCRGTGSQVTCDVTAVTNNNQLSNGAGYITDGNTNWDNSYGFITSNNDDDDIGVEEDNSVVDSSVYTIDFGNGLDVTTDGTSEVNVVADCVEITGSSALCDGGDAVNDADSSTTNEIQTLGTSGNTITLTSGGSVTAPYATTAGDLSCTDCIGPTEITDSYVLNSGDTLTGALNMNNNLITNIGSAGTDFTSGGGLDIAGDLKVSGNDIKDSTGTARISFSSGDVIITLG